MGRSNLPTNSQGALIDSQGTVLDASKASPRARKYVNINRQKIQKPIRSQIEAMKGGEDCWIYNASRVFQWTRPYQHLGQFMIPRAPKEGSWIIKDGKRVEATKEDIQGDFKLSEPVEIHHSYMVTTDKGEGRRVPYVEYGEDIAEAIVGNSKLYPSDLANPTSNLETWGVFITYGRPYHELPKAERDQLYLQAQAQIRRRYQDKVMKGDQLYEMAKPRGKGGPLEIHRLCALELGVERPWVSNRGLLTMEAEDKVLCPFCESKIRPTVIKCPNCKEIVNIEAYEAQKKRLKSQPEAKPTQE